MRSDRTSIIRGELIRRDLDDGVIDILALEHSSEDNNPTNNDGAGLIWRLQDKTALSKLIFEAARLDVVGTDLTLSGLNVDFNFYQRIAGTQTNTFSIDADGGFKINISPLVLTSGDATTEFQVNNTAVDGDPYLSFALSSVRKFSFGVDDGDSDKLKLGTTAIGTGTVMEWDTTQARMRDDIKLAFGDASEATFEYDEDGTDNLRYDGVDMIFDVATKVLFRDSALFIFSSGDGQLDIDADTELELTAPTVQIAASTKFDVDSNAIDFGTNADVDIVLTFNALTADGILTWMEDEDYFLFSDDAMLAGSERIYFRDGGISIFSSLDGRLDIRADTLVYINTPTLSVLSDLFNWGVDLDTDIVFNFATNGRFSWIYDTAYFQFDNDILLATTENLFFRDAAIHLNSSLDGQLDIDADIEIEITAPTIDLSGNVDISTGLDVTGDITVTGLVDGVDIAGFNAVQFVAIAADANVANERVLTAGDGLDLTDAGAGLAVTLAVDVTDILGNGLGETTNNIFAYSLRSTDDGENALIADADGRLIQYGARFDALYHWKEDFDDEISGVQWEGGIRADYWTTGGTNYNANNVTYAGGAGGTVTAITAGADDDSVFSFGNTIYRIDANCILEARFKVLDITNVFIGVGLVEGSFVSKAAPDDDICVVGIDSDNGHGFGAARIVAITNDNNAGAVYSDCGVDITLDTFITIRIDLTDTEQPRIWVNNTGGVITAANEVTPASITGTVQAGISVGAYFMVQSLSAAADTFTIDFIDAWQARA